MTRQQYAIFAVGHNNTYEPMRCQAPACRKQGACAFARPVQVPYNTRTFWILDFLCPDHFEEAARLAGKLPAKDA